MTSRYYLKRPRNSTNAMFTISERDESTRSNGESQCNDDHTETAVVKLVVSAGCLVAAGSAPLSAAWRLTAVQIGREPLVLPSPRYFRWLGERPLDMLRVARSTPCRHATPTEGDRLVVPQTTSSEPKTQWPPAVNLQTIQSRFFTVCGSTVLLTFNGG